jgi:uncharacterized membrane protein
MTSDKKPTEMEDAKINVKLKLSALWIAVMFLFAYVDILSHMQPGIIEEFVTGEVAGFQITETWMLGVTVMMSIPALMVFLSLALKPKFNRLSNIIVAILKIIIVVGSNFIGTPWAYYIFGSILEVVLLSLIIWYALVWPKQ